MLRKDGASVAEMNTILLSNCITEVNGELVVDPLELRPRVCRCVTVRRSSVRDGQHQPNVDLTVSVPCDGCGEGQQINFGWLDFFRP